MQERGYYVPPELQQRLNGGTGKSKTQFQQRNQKNYSNPDLNTKSAVNFDRTFYVKRTKHVKLSSQFPCWQPCRCAKTHCVNANFGKSFAERKRFYYLDTHSGVGRYRLSSNESEKPANTKRELGDFGKEQIYPKKLLATWLSLKNSIMAVKNYVIMPGHQ